MNRPVEPHRVGPPLEEGDTRRCAYSDAPGTPRCPEAPVVHALSIDPAEGVPCFLYACDRHAELAVMLSADSHAFGESCRTALYWTFGSDDEAVPSSCTNVWPA